MCPVLIFFAVQEFVNTSGRICSTMRPFPEGSVAFCKFVGRDRVVVDGEYIHADKK